MFEFTIERPKFRIYFTDSSPKSTKFSTKNLRSYLETAAECLSLWSWKKGSPGLGLPSRIKMLECQLQICGTTKIRTLNREYRDKDKKTDVLSFQMIEGLRTDDCETVTPVLNLGDLFICREVAQRQATQFGISYEEEVAHLFIHGWLHLCGFDHEISAVEEKIMEAHEQKLLGQMAQMRRKAK